MEPDDRITIAKWLNNGIDYNSIARKATNAVIIFHNVWDTDTIAIRSIAKYAERYTLF